MIREIYDDMNRLLPFIPGSLCRRSRDFCIFCNIPSPTAIILGEGIMHGASMPIRTVLVTALLTLSVCLNVTAEDQPAPSFTDEQIAFFESKIRPVLANSCYSCHSVDKLKKELKRPKGGIKFDSRAAILKDYLAEPGKPEESIMIEAVRYDNPDNQMPPTGKLPDDVIKNLEKWVEMGLPWPDEGGATIVEDFNLEERQSSHWAWKAPKRAAGQPSDARAIDALLEKQLKKEGFKPGPQADREMLIRRVTLDLTGLPPSTQEIDAFISDKSPKAYENLVDRLLASPRYGEKWARHWLDLVRYAESYGHEFDFNIPHAWKYRDYVIRAMNDDVPYDRFVKEHIAGDLIEPRIHPETKVNEAIKATGWWFLHEQTHAPTDVRLHEADRIDNQIDVMSKTFMGMTVACARCHDHMFDAISTADYYSLAGFMQSSRQQEAYLDADNRFAAVMDAAEKIAAQGQAEFEKLGAPKLEPTKIDHADTRLFEDFNAGSYNGWKTTGWAWDGRPTVPGQWNPRSGMAAPVLPGVAHSGLLGDKALGTIRSPEFNYQERHIWMRVKGKGHVRMIIDSFTMGRHSELLFEGLKANIDTKGKWQWVRLSARRDFYHGNGNHRAHLEFIDDDHNAHLMIDEVRFGDKGGPPNPAPDSVPGSVKPEADPAFAAITKQFNDSLAKAPGLDRVLAITDGSAEDSYVHIRGGWHGKGEATPRRILTALGGENEHATQEGSGRADLANRIVDPKSPLAARVQVNRLWHHLFGRGISPTVDNFGYLGIEPSNLELLDHLAIVFVENDKWSNKAMIKRIVMSKAYQRSSDKQSDAIEEKDPENILLRRQNIRRMTAETLRDSVLFVAGSLNEQRYGPPVGTYLTQYMQGRGRPRGGPLDGNGRRSIYTSVRRNFLPPMMLTFDTPIPFSTVGKRNVTTVPAQSLTLMNDPFVHDQAKKWADRLVKDGSKSVGERIDSMFKSALGRLPSKAERAASIKFISDQAQQHNIKLETDKVLADARVWRELCHAAFNLKGFLYVR